MKYCDLVMKGGITSGLVYPNAVLALSRDYRFKNIGGTSAGAIAAAVSAAAAYGDRQKLGGAAGPELGFAGLEKTAATLGTKGFIFGLFQPAYGVRQAFRLLVALTGHGSALQKFGAFLLAIPLMAPAEILFVLAVLLVLGFWLGGGWGGIAAALIPALLCAFAAGVVGAVLRVARVARRNLLGLCNGMPGKGKSHPALTEWLYDRVQTLAGKPLTEPLTFGHLWAAARYEDEPPTEKSIQLQVITTDVSHHEPLSLPSEREFWFRDDQFDKLFPAPLMAALKELPAEPVGAHTYRRLPKGADLPVIIAARMSLSFPVLISAIPLHEKVYRKAAPAAAAEDGTVSEQPFGAADDESYDARPTASTTEVTFRELWFSDGGISSNFPVHLFDSALPRWPTFAVNLVDERNLSRSLEDSVWIPPGNNEGWRQKHYPIAAPMAAKELLNFLFGIIATMQNWRDLQQARAPGYRDRIAHVALSKDEGGLNLDMPADVLKKISDKGAIAGARFSGFSFNNHYWIRWRNVASTLQGFTRQLAQNSRSPIPDYAPAHDIGHNLTEPPSYKFSSNDRREAAAKLLTSLEDQGKDWTDLGPDLSTGAPSPRPVLRITPTY